MPEMATGLRHQRRQLLRALGAGLLGALSAKARAAVPATLPVELQPLQPRPTLQGQGRFGFIGFTLYDIRLWQFGRPVDADYARQDFALELQYHRALSGWSVADRALTEMRRIAGFSEAQADQWRSAMRAAFPDLQVDDRLTGLVRQGEPVRFFHNGRPTTEIGDAAFTAAFFGIWLAPQTSRPELRRVLLGLEPRFGAGA